MFCKQIIGSNQKCKSKITFDFAQGNIDDEKDIQCPVEYVL